MKRYAFLSAIVAMTLFFFLWPPRAARTGIEAYAEGEGRLLLPQHNVAIAVLDLKAAGLSITRSRDLPRLRALQEDLSGLSGVQKVESILSASRVITKGDDIIVSRAIPADDAEITDDYLLALSKEIKDFPELKPYLNGKQDTLLFYVYFANKTPSVGIYRDLGRLRAKWSGSMDFDFTGRAPIIAETESLITGDIVLFFPLLALMIIVVLAFFRSLKAIAASLVLIFISIAAAYSLVRFLGFVDTPLLLLVPVFCLGLLSDYAIHFLYHYFHDPRIEGAGDIRRILFFPLSLTALSTVTGFLSLSLINGSGHLQLGILIAAAVLATWFGVFFWLGYWRRPALIRPRTSRFSLLQGRLFVKLAKYRYPLFILIAAATAWGGAQLHNLSIEPYPIEQLPETTTIKRADARINTEFYGTLPFFVEIDTGEKDGILKKATLLEMEKIQAEMEGANAGYVYSILTVLKRMNYYFMGSEESLLSGTEFDEAYDTLIQQYLLYFSSSVDPLEYESLLDSSYRLFSMKGLLYYRNYEDLNGFLARLDGIRANLPPAWSLNLHGMAAQLKIEHDNLRKNWLFAFLGGGILIFATVLLFYRRLKLAVISLIPAAISMIVSFGWISAVGISIDAFSIIFVAIITGLVIDYSIHTLVALEQVRSGSTLAEGFGIVIGFSGVPIFLSFLTSLLSFLVLLLSSFKGARSLGLLMIISLVLSFALSLYLIPLIVLPNRSKRETNRA